MVFRVEFKQNFKNVDNFSFNLSEFGERIFNLWKPFSESIRSVKSPTDKILVCASYDNLKPRISKILAIPDAIKNLRAYTIKMEQEIKEYNEKENEELESILHYDID